ncbi:response regulator transcription factor [Paraclostridium bifermentans]|uniref:response regulator transcription factor n=1 Tax=Paraclostridium bifermentans TaxID=1490 RepID=UPI00359C6DBE
MEQIFIVEDEVKLRKEAITLIEKNGYKCVTTDDYNNIVDKILETNSDLLLLDINLPVNDGFYICKEIRKKSDIPIIVITSSKSDIDELDMLNLGADDFINKPYNPRILLAHINSVLKRTYGKQNSVILTHKGVKLDVLKGIASFKGNSVELTKNEIGILSLLMENKGNIIPRNEIIRHLWDMEEFVGDSTLTVNINRVRKKLESIGANDYLVTKRGLGYTV